MNRQLRAARRVRCEQLRYVVIISVRSCQCHRTRSSFQVAAKSRTSRFETTIEDENRDEKMIRTKSNRIPLYERTLRIEDDTRTTDTRAPTRKYVPRGKRCVTITIPSLDSNDRSIFSRPLVFGRGRDNATEFASTWFYTGQSHPLFASAAEKSIAGFRDAIFSNIVIVVCTFVVSHGA